MWRPFGVVVNRDASRPSHRPASTSNHICHRVIDRVK